MADLAKIVDDLSSLTVLEAAELAKLLEEKAIGNLLEIRSRGKEDQRGGALAPERDRRRGA